MTRTQAEGLLTRYPVMRRQTSLSLPSCVALAARFEIDGRLLDVYVTHQSPPGGRCCAQYQVGQLLDWIRSRDDADLHRLRRLQCDSRPAIDSASCPVFRPTQTQPTAFTAAEPGARSHHPGVGAVLIAAIDYIWVTESIKVGLRVFALKPAPDNPTLWPSDHVGVWADLELV
jgi:endonuclease/exonuclease/phosphatase family metal-dependent hydrolase